MSVNFIHKESAYGKQYGSNMASMQQLPQTDLFFVLFSYRIITLLCYPVYKKAALRTKLSHRFLSAYNAKGKFISVCCRLFLGYCSIVDLISIYEKSVVKLYNKVHGNINTPPFPFFLSSPPPLCCVYSETPSLPRRQHHI